MAARGVLIATEPFAAEEMLTLAREIEARGYDSLWLPEMFGREPFATAGWLLGRTERIAVGTAIANVYVRDVNVMAQARRSLAELSAGRFLLGLGVSSARLNASRGHEWQPPLEKMRAFLDALDAARVDAPAPATACPTYIAAHGPLLQRLAARRTDGVITYLMPPEHTHDSRLRIGEQSSLDPVVFFLAECDPDIARRKARAAIRVYVQLDYYHREWRKLGFTDADFAGGGSDALIDRLVAWGDDRALQDRVTAFERAGASRVIVLPLGLRTKEGIDWRVLDALSC